MYQTTCMRFVHSLLRQRKSYKSCAYFLAASRTLHSRGHSRDHSLRHCSTALSPPTPEGQEKEYPRKIKDIVDQISQLTLLEVSELNDLLKKTLNISDAPIMSMGVAAAAPAAPPEEEETTTKKFEQTEFTLNLVKYDDSKKVALIKAIKSVMSGMNLVQAKKFVESAPQTVKENVSKEEAENIKKTLEEQGAVIEME